MDDPAQDDLLERLTGGDRRSIGRADEVVGMVLEEPMRLAAIVAGLWHGDPVVRMRAGDVVEKVSRVRPDLVAVHREALLRLTGETDEQEARWHLLQTLPRLGLDGAGRAAVVAFAEGRLDDASRIVRVSALQALADLAADDATLAARVAELFERVERAGSPAERARVRRLRARRR